MAPVTTAPQTHTTNVASLKNGSATTTVKPAVVPQRARAILEEKLSSQELMHLESEYSAHNYHPLPVVFERALGAKAWDPEGREYIDMLSAYSAVNQGHCHPAIVKTLQEQSMKLTLSSRAFFNSVFGRFAKTMNETFKYDMVLPMNTGAEAVETSLKLARKWGYMKKGIPEGKARIFSAEGNFHGRTLGVISMSTDPDSRTGFGPYLERVGPTFEVPNETGDEEHETRTIRYGSLPDLELALSIYGHETAAILLEPIQGEAGIVVPPQGYLKGVRDLCKKHNVLLICDEIQTGLGRTGRMLASEWDLDFGKEGEKPDVVLLGKALSGGMYPVSAVLASKEVMLCIRPGEHGSTYGGNPLGCAVAITAVAVLEEERMIERAERLGRVFREGVEAIKKRGGAAGKLIREVRGRGLLNAVVFEEGESKKGRTAWEFCLLLKARGVLAKPTHRNIIRFAPPLVIEEEDLRKAINIIEQCLEDIDTIEEIPGDTEEERTHVDEIAI